jgi:hypothetical protein
MLSGASVSAVPLSAVPVQTPATVGNPWYVYAQLNRQ